MTAIDHEALLDPEALLELLECAPCGMLVVSLDGRIVLQNRTASMLLGARSDPTSGLATRCPPPIGVPEPPFASSFALAAGLVVYGRFLVRVARLGPDRRFVVTSPNEPAQPRRDEFGRLGASSSGECPVGTRPRVR